MTNVKSKTQPKKRSASKAKNQQKGKNGGSKQKDIMPDRKSIIAYCICGAVIALTIILYIEYDNRRTETAEYENICNCASRPINSNTELADKQILHIEHAKHNGLKNPIRNGREFEEEIQTLTKEKRLIQLKETRYYTTEAFDHATSMPYVTPDTEKMLQLIGITFQENLLKNDMPKYKLNVTAALYSSEEKSPYIAAEYGTTVFVSYKNYIYRGKTVTDKKANQILEESLSSLRQKCKCIVTDLNEESAYMITLVTH